MQALSELIQQAEADIAAADDLTALDAVRVAYVGKKGELTARMKQLGSLPAEERPAAGQKINRAMQAFNATLDARRGALQDAALSRQLAEDAVDVTLPGRGLARGSRHPVSRAMARIERIFRDAGFGVRSGPEIEDDYHNFTALNIPENHPARAMHDTFYFPGGNLLRTHTSPVQIRSMVEEGVPIRITGDFREWLNSAGAKRFPVEQRVLDIETARAPARVCALLGLEAGAVAWRMRRLRYRDGQPISYHVNYGAPDRFAWIEEATLAGGRGFVETISARGDIPLKRMAQRVEAVTADLELADLLATGFGQALFFVENVYRAADDTVLAVTHLYLRADCYTYEVEIDLGGSMLRDTASP